MSRIEEIYKPALQSKNIPILTLDNKWHRLFTQANSNQTIKRLVSSLNNLVKRQGKLTTEIKEIRKIKAKLMEEIIELRDSSENSKDKEKNKKLAESSRLISECNEKTVNHQEELLDLPKKIKEINMELMLETMEVCYDAMHANVKKIDEIKKWLLSVRIELKKRLVRKEQTENMNKALYHYMHDIFGADVIEIFDMKYDLENQKEKKKKIEIAEDENTK